ncbi:hypothetical protein PGTUg99_032620 [Puccinia graminis f. sp. tritici]|uniref:HAT C-terminal dimerisation domain-containing protein n=1 Tax=Puccinia graminis f. sp. tritici TaxID=56615 RepID=A0A5B0PGZ5_PUCGR|nr:hypothetical protein PGTUg99_032620 [Puccinia graminis f. sp. tritici]
MQIIILDEVEDGENKQADVQELDSNIEEFDNDEELEEIDPDDASNHNSSTEDESPSLAPAEGGIGHTLMKVDYICQRFSSLSAQQREFKLVSKKLGCNGPQLIAGYRIRWNVAYNSWQQAYQARKVIDQILDDESKKFAGRSAATHYFKGYEISKKEWENINSLTQVLEGDGPNSSMILYEYYRLIDNLEKRKKNHDFTVLQAMFDPMIVVAKNAVAEELLRTTFKAKIKAHKKMMPQVTTPESSAESDEDKFNYYPEKSGASQEDKKLKKYIEGQWPLSKKADPLQWWKLHALEFPWLALIARDVLACAGSSETVERTFSAAADVCQPGRSLAAPTIERCVSSHMWLRNAIKASGPFAEAQSVIDTATGNKKFKSYIANENKKYEANKIKHVGESIKK